MPAEPGTFGAVRGERAGGWLAQTRSEVLARHGMVATSHPLAAQAGLEILRGGGNAFDAAVATAAVLGVVEPGSAGIGGDVFVIAWHAREGQLIALNGSGRSVAAADFAHLAKRGHGRQMPLSGIDSATVPGAVDAWDVLLKRAGSMTFKEVLKPAATIAAEGFGVSERAHGDWREVVEVLRSDEDSRRVHLVNGAAPSSYSLYRNADLARAYEALRAEGRDAFYRGDIAAALLRKSRALGGAFTAEDLASARADWVQPLSVTYHGHEVFEFPPNTQGFAALEMLNILAACEARLGEPLARLGPASPLYWHLLVEAKKLAYADLYAYNGDPEYSQTPLQHLLSESHAASQCARIDLHRAAVAEAKGDPVGGTVYLATADAAGNMVSFIFSIYETFGSGVTVPGYGFVLNNRAALFSLDPQSPNALAPRKRPFHTLLPGFVMKEGAPFMAFGLMGGAQQAQGHVQVLVNLIDLGANLQAASDAARFSHAQATNILQLESPLCALMGEPLRRLGHQVVAANGRMMGGYQAIALRDGIYRGASDHRKDGQAVGW
jgi:gamma-glutamyltranspeptidase/glutathione hydrolase